MLPVDEFPPDGDLPISFKGLRVDERKLRLDSDEKEAANYLAVSSRSEQERLFTPVAKEIAGLVIEDGFSPLAAIMSTIRRWRGFWEKGGEGELTRSQLVGLLGEVWILRHVLIPELGAGAIDRWLGPNGERHDFQGRAVHIEVKVTEKQIPLYHVSSLEQMEVPEDKTLYVAALMIRGEAGGSVDLVSEVRGCETALSEDLSKLEEFQAKLAAVGYRRESETDYRKYRFIVRSADLYAVNEDFPSLTHSSVVVPTGVSGVEYQIDLSNVACLSQAEYSGALTAL